MTWTTQLEQCIRNYINTLYRHYLCLQENFIPYIIYSVFEWLVSLLLVCSALEKKIFFASCQFLQIQWKWWPFCGCDSMVLRICTIFFNMEPRWDNIFLSSNCFLWLKQWVPRHSGANLYSCYSILLHHCSISLYSNKTVYNHTKPLNKYIITIYVPRIDSYIEVLEKCKFKICSFAQKILLAFPI